MPVKKVLFIVAANAKCRKNKEYFSTPPLGLLSMASVLRMHGYRTAVIDLLVQEISRKNFTQQIRDFQPDLVALSAYTEGFTSALQIAKTVKEVWNHAKIVMGGPHVSFEYEEALEQKNIDFVIRFEGEFSLLLLLEHLNHPEQFPVSKVKGLVYKKDGKPVLNELYGFIKSLDALPLSAIDLVDLEKYKSPFTLITSRGCPGVCIFCSSKAMSGKTYRYRSAESIIAEIYYIGKYCSKDRFVLLDDTFTADEDHLKKFCRLYRRSGLSYNWRCTSRVDKLSVDLLDLLFESGCRTLHMGVESGNQGILKSIRKGINLNDGLSLVKYANKKGFLVACSFILGHHADTVQTMENTLSLIRELKSEGIFVSLSSNTPYPGTYLNEHAKELGITIHARSWDQYQLSNAIVSNKHIDLDTLNSYLFRGYQLCMH